MTNIIKGDFSSELKDRYLTYALSTITSRALPDVRDGMKPVHRRLLFAMRQLKLMPNSSYKKCARVVGDVIGKYHPHGDQSVYNAMVRLAQDFAVRYPLVDGQGNFGSVDGDSAAAMRYTEAKLTKVAEFLLKDLDQGTVDYIDNYDESESEPAVLPACFPNLLANGASGIAVGLATSIPPHNVGELCDGLMAILKSPNCHDETLFGLIKAPDFPTGGVIVEDHKEIQKAYLTGRGSIRLRAKWEVEDLGRGQYQIVITQIPYQVTKSKLIEKIADLVVNKKIPFLADIMDESDENMRIVLEPKTRTVNAEALMEQLFKLTDLETRFSVNMNALNDKGAPELMSLRRMLECFINHRRNVLVRKSNYRLDKIADRLHILAAYMVVYVNLDEVIEIIKTQDQPKPVMMERFNITEIQAEAILNMRLRRLRKLDELEIKKEITDLEKEQEYLRKLVADDDLQAKELKDEFKTIKKEFADERRSTINAHIPDIDVSIEDQIEKEPVTVLLSEKGWIKAVKGHIKDQEVKYKEGDEEFVRLETHTTEKTILFTAKGRAYTLQNHLLPAGRGFGEPVNMIVDINGDEIIQAFTPLDINYVVTSQMGYAFKSTKENLISQTKNGKQIINIGKKDSAKIIKPIKGNMFIAFSEAGKMLAFPLQDLPELGRGKGVKTINVKDGDSLLDFITFDYNYGFIMQSLTGAKRQRTISKDDFVQFIARRATTGKKALHGFTNGAEFLDLELKEDQELNYKMPDELVEKTKAIPTDALVDMMGKDEEEPSLFDFAENTEEE
ncbi:MAG TPA: DNA topoisomerase IV subunit A [Alphaproteobacteria bacterium]|nr:DNA topoisomerase IV subunit A [Alphaproteobacteria bacterium]